MFNHKFTTMKRLYLLLAIAAIGIAACHNENPQEVIPPVEEKEVDARLKFMDDVCALGIEVDDDLFLWHLENKVFYYGNDSEGTASRCSYGDIGMYGSKDGEMIWNLPSGNWDRNNRTLIMMDNGYCRTHGIWGYFPNENLEENRFPEYEYDEKGYRNRYWRYDTETNMLYTNMWGLERVDDSCAEVLYVDSRIAILKGQIMNEPSTKNADWGYFYVDFKKYDREAYMSEYDKDFTYYPEYIEGDWELIEMDKSVLTFDAEGGTESSVALNYDCLWLCYAGEYVANDNGTIQKSRYYDPTEDGLIIEALWFRVEIPEGRENELVMTVKKNNTQMPREGFVEFQVAGGDAFSFIEIRQMAE